jgi:hypothetical protein
LGGLINVATSTFRGLVTVRPFADPFNAWKPIGQQGKAGLAPALAVF